mmetsp:Transcript_54650/g.122289  ORF Transcript_54650/g.122289 Transcript_54650/m.122289 type:complete len:203 (-) Transcript_54650:164-772(-)
MTGPPRRFCSAITVTPTEASSLTLLSRISTTHLIHWLGLTSASLISRGSALASLRTNDMTTWATASSSIIYTTTPTVPAAGLQRRALPVSPPCSHTRQLATSQVDTPSSRRLQQTLAAAWSHQTHRAMPLKSQALCGRTCSTPTTRPHPKSTSQISMATSTTKHSVAWQGRRVRELPMMTQPTAQAVCLACALILATPFFFT